MVAILLISSVCGLVGVIWTMVIAIQNGDVL